MSYAQFGLIEAGDYNYLATGATNGVPNHNVANMNTVYATGTGNKGYGQTALATETAGSTITAASKWAGLVNNSANAAAHQGSTITSITAPVSGGTITYLSALPTNITAVFNNRLNASGTGTTSTSTATRSTSWSQYLTFTHTVTFASGDAARYFFNAGGQIKMTMSHPTGTAIDNLFNALATASGTIVQSSPVSGTVSIAGVNYNGITKVGGSGTPTTLGTNLGYYAMTATNQTVFKQIATTGPSGYLSTFIQMDMKTNGTQGSNGDAGSVVTITTTWDEIPNGLAVTAGSAVTLTLVPPRTTYLPTASWGTPVLASSVTGA
jgi:hypothetical protein